MERTARTMEALGRGLLEDACALFCGRHDDALVERVAARVRGPYELPYAFLDEGMPLARGAMADEVAPAERHVELAYKTILQRHPESEDVVRAHAARHRSMASLLGTFLLGGEYRARAALLVARCTPLVPRIWHVHIPKTAGTSFFRAFESAGWAVVNATNLADPGFGIGGLAQVLNLERLRRGVLFTGHQSLANVVPLLLPYDVCLAFVRHPLERAASFFNYMKRRLDEDPNLESSDTRDFLARGFDPSSLERTYAEGRILVRNEQCAHLSQDRTAAAALATARRVHCRLYDTSRTSALIEELVGIASPPRHNASPRLVDAERLAPSLVRRILDENAEDLALYEAVRGA